MSAEIPSGWRFNLTTGTAVLANRDEDLLCQGGFLVATVLGVISLCFFLVTLDRGEIFTPIEHPLYAPGINKWACSRNNSGLPNVLLVLKRPQGKQAHLFRLVYAVLWTKSRYVAGRESKAVILRFRVLSKSLLNAKLALTLAILMHSINEHEISKTCSQDPSTLSRYDEAIDRFVQSKGELFQLSILVVRT